MKSTLLRFFILFLIVGVSGCRIRNNPPELTGLSPRQAFVGQEVTLTGYQFGSQPTVTVGVGASAVTAKITRQDANSITVTVPLVTPGLTQIRVHTDEGTSDPLPFTVQQPAPAVTVLTPTNALPGSPVVISGNYLNQLRQVRFGEFNAVVSDSSAQKLTVVVPPNVPRGPQPLVIETSGGQLIYAFIVAGTPQITRIAPRVTRPGTELVIQGVNLLDGVVRINGRVVEKALTNVRDTEIRLTIPAEATSGQVTVSVFEKLIATSPDTVQIVQQPVLASLSARDGVAGDKLILTGRNLRDITGVTFDRTSAAFRVLNDTQLEATVPALTASASVVVSVSSVGGNASATDPFFFYLPPSNLVVSPARQLRGQPITISGQNLYRITEVRVSGRSVPITSRNEGTDLLVSVPSDAVSGPVTVVSRAGSATSAKPLVVVQKPVVTSIIPQKARPGDRVVLRGDFLLNAPIYFSGTTTPAADGGRNDDAERWVIVPATAQTGPLRVTNATNDATLTDVFTVLRLIANVDFTPKTAKVGEEVILTGQNLASTTEVRFGNGTSVPAKFSLDGPTLKVIVPAGATSGQICLTNDAGTTCTSASFTVGK